jgi:thiol-disulfide isomerase/thioredoxin
MADKYSKVTPKVHPLTLAIIAGFFAVIIGLILIFTPSNQEKIYDAYKNGSDTTFFTEDHPFFEVTYKGSLFRRGLERIIEKEEIVVLYIGAPSCAGCLKHIGAFDHYFDLENMNDFTDRIYYLDSVNDLKGFKELFEKFQQVTAATPQLIVFKDGAILATYTAPTAPAPGQTERQAINKAVQTFFNGVVKTLREA